MPTPTDKTVLFLTPNPNPDDAARRAAETLLQLGLSRFEIQAGRFNGDYHAGDVSGVRLYPYQLELMDSLAGQLSERTTRSEPAISGTSAVQSPEATANVIADAKPDDSEPLATDSSGDEMVDVDGVGLVELATAPVRYYYSPVTYGWYKNMEYSGDWECDRCETTKGDGDEQNETEEDGMVCGRCASRHYTFSEVQGTLINDNDCVRYEDDDDAVSSRDWAGRNAYQRGNDWYLDDGNMPADVYAYATNIFRVLGIRRPDTTDFIMGVELEMEPDDGATQAEIVEALGGRHGDGYILSADGSLDDGGVELITLPCSLASHQRGFGWAERLGKVAGLALSGAGTTNCGMHVHVNRRALSPLQIGKILVFINCQANRELVISVAQRESSFSRFTAKKIGDARRSLERYEAVNLQNAETIEFRIFRGNLRPERVLKNIEFVHAVCHYVKDLSVENLENPALFVAWVVKLRKQYPHLFNFLVEKNWTPALRLPPTVLVEA